jgi:hypothetical protein
MSIFDTIENFPWTHENEQGDIVKTQASDYYTFICVKQELENIFNNNARIKL